MPPPARTCPGRRKSTSCSKSSASQSQLAPPIVNTFLQMSIPSILSSKHPKHPTAPAPAVQSQLFCKVSKVNSLSDFRSRKLKVFVHGNITWVAPPKVITEPTKSTPPPPNVNTFLENQHPQFPPAPAPAAHSQLAPPKSTTKVNSRPQSQHLKPIRASRSQPGAHKVNTTSSKCQRFPRKSTPKAPARACPRRSKSTHASIYLR